MARPREPWRRERLLDAALVVMSRQGPSAVRIKDIAAEAGVSPATIHYHFDGIEEIFVGVIERVLDQMYHQRLAALDSVTSIPDKLRLLIDLGVADEPSTELVLMYEGIAMMRSQARFAPLVSSFVERQVSLYRSVIDAGVHAGVFTPSASTGTIARNLLAMEDAYDLYITVGALRDGALARSNMLSYAEAALGVSLTRDDTTLTEVPA